MLQRAFNRTVSCTNNLRALRRGTSLEFGRKFHMTSSSPSASPLLSTFVLPNSPYSSPSLSRFSLSSSLDSLSNSSDSLSSSSSSVSSAGSAASSPLFSFGVVTDIQYANRQTKPGKERYELDALYKLNKCISYWKEYHHPLKCVVNLGDIIDGHEGDPLSHKKDMEDLRDVLNAFNALDIPKYHVLGNHCVWNLGCNNLAQELGMKSRYYDVAIHDGWRFVILDGTDLSIMKDSHSPTEAQDYMRANSHRFLEDWNGGISKKQQEWFRGVVASAKQNNEKLIVFCHWPLLNKWGPEMESSMMWNADEILPLLDPEAVFMYMSGHIHENGYMHHNGVHHVTLSAIVSAPVGENAHAVVHIAENEVVVEGFGTVLPLSGVLRHSNNKNNTNNIVHYLR